MKKLKIGFSLIIGIGFSNLVFAGGSQVADQSARGQSMQAFNAVADDASAIYYNPAGLTQLTDPQIQINAIGIIPNSSYINSLTHTETHSYKNAFGGTFYAAVPTKSGVVFGIGLYTPNARIATYQINAGTYFLPLEGQLIRMDLAPTIAFHLAPTVSVGASVIFSRVMFELNTLGLYEKGTGQGVTGRLGILWEATDKLKFAAGYTAPMQTNVNGKGYFLNGFASGRFFNNFDFPGIINLGFSYRINPRLLFSFALEDEMYSSFKQFVRDYDNPIINSLTHIKVTAKDAYNIRTGVEYALTPKDSLRLGFSYQTPGLAQNSIIPPAADYFAYFTSVGYSHTYKNWRVDAGYELAYLPKRQGFQSVFPGTYKLVSNNILLGLTYNFTA
jgi:long-chain fatty acid transport protein